MAWSPLFPDGSKSVKDNNPIGLGNTVYTKATLNIDHYWNIGVNEDGHHKQAQMTKTVAAGVPADVALAAGMDSALYAKQKTAAESVVQQDVNLYLRNATANIMQMLGIRACVVWNIVAGPDPTNQTIVYAHNVTSVARQIAGRYQIHYTNALPSDNYIVLGGGMATTADSTFDSLYGSVASGSTVATRKNTTDCIFMLRNQNLVLTNAMQGWFVCFGG
jgi:hypothetical protein